MKIRDIPRMLSPTGWLIGAVLLLILLMVAWYLITEPGRARHRTAEARAAGAYAEARTAAAGDALDILDAANAARTQSEQLTQENADAIQKAPGAAQRLDPRLNAAGRDSLCKRSAYINHPACAVQHPDRRQPAR